MFGCLNHRVVIVNVIQTASGALGIYRRSSHSIALFNFQQYVLFDVILTCVTVLTQFLLLAMFHLPTFKHYFYLECVGIQTATFWISHEHPACNKRAGFLFEVPLTIILTVI